ncbi:hypothetical protein CAPTEDRAFT_206876 [Capitella teleta]|uniref:RING-type domain-containing protein n=1 Tax=Capitella teleta TaxID=283909 RepID=R7UPB8_CAPTE|nr:hypothetical protein CAPTEDRAFT_206876 [Capitella teleta]|eukprot:ELU05246.1 hypothetical protein CAPTEDRAFT_206876 [Capitella teleta]
MGRNLGYVQRADDGHITSLSRKSWNSSSNLKREIFLHREKIFLGPFATFNSRNHKVNREEVADKVCCLCEEPVKRTLFGMLSHCNHVFCVECLRGWRCAPGREHMLKRTCPKCRVISKTAIASPLWISDPCTKAKRMKSVRPLQ